MNELEKKLDELIDVQKTFYKWFAGYAEHLDGEIKALENELKELKESLNKTEES